MFINDSLITSFFSLIISDSRPDKNWQLQKSVTSVHNQALLTCLLPLFAWSVPKLIWDEERHPHRRHDTVTLQPAAAAWLIQHAHNAAPEKEPQKSLKKATQSGFLFTSLPCLFSCLTLHQNLGPSWRLDWCVDKISTGVVVVMFRQIYLWYLDWLSFSLSL